ncbi:hypothetical protein KIW84_033646 [Lathyrus oleraceus]|uniref:Helicase ATP-binding domain-containing protein n=1 Tax=Pisum sativum TaxID=3888 RepID=A0A9D4Y182_PEA|nr:hypothetical protein KIW84_033646 [Pisum sativum]
MICSKSMEEAEKTWSKLLQFESNPPSQAFVYKMEVYSKVGVPMKSLEVFREMQLKLDAINVEVALRHVEDEADYMALKKVELEEAVDNQEFTLEAWHLKRQQMQPFLQFYHPLSCIITAAFCVPALEKIDQDNNVIQVIILVPTRELALQTSQVCKELAKHLQIQVMVTTGGTSLKDDIRHLYQLIHLLVGTPGRILDLTKKGVCILKHCSMLVMDEADKLLSPEFQPLIQQLIHFLPTNLLHDINHNNISSKDKK